MNYDQDGVKKQSYRNLEFRKVELELKLLMLVKVYNCIAVELELKLLMLIKVYNCIALSVIVSIFPYDLTWIVYERD